MSRPLLPTYRLEESFATNLRLGPRFDAPLPKTRFFNPCQLFDRKLNSPLGIAAGLLLDSKWIGLYASLSFDVLTYKTVRTRKYPSHNSPNLCEVVIEEQLTPERFNQELTGHVESQHILLDRISATNSFGMPSLAPKDWMEDMKAASKLVRDGQVLVASVVGTPDGNGNLNDLAADYALCAQQAVQSGAMIVEANFSCPNVASEEGSIYADPQTAGRIAAAIRQRIGETPLLIKLGYFEDETTMEQTMDSLAPHICGVTAINTIGMTVVHPKGDQRFPGRPIAGVGGWAIRHLGLKTVEALCQVRERLGVQYAVVGVGGITEPAAVQQYLDVGADVVEVATAAIWNPYLAHEVGSALWREIPISQQEGR